MLNSRYKNDGKPSIPLTDIQQKAKANVERKTEDKTYVFEQTTCPVCDGSSYETLSEKDRYGLSCNTVICKNCGMLMTNPRMTKESLNKFYSDDYRELYVGSKNAEISFFDRQYKHGKRIVTFIKKHTKHSSLHDLFVMEVGCGAGGILSAFKDEGAEVFGLDLGSDYLEYGVKHHGLNLQTGEIKNYISKKPDIIIYSHVLEHTCLPDEIINIRNVCRDDTLLYVEVPGIMFIQKSYTDFMLYLQNAHLYHFSLETLNNLLSRYGFSLICGNERIESIFRSTGQSRLQRTNMYDKIMKYLLVTEKKRRWNKFKRKIHIRKSLVFVLEKLHLLDTARKILVKQHESS
jgi:transcription elongation factor Elf1